MTWMLRRNAAKRAQELLEHYGVEEREHIRLEDIAFDRGIEIVRGGLEGSAARLSRRGRFARLRLPAEGSPKDRFSIAHELGHHCMHADTLRACTEANMAEWHSDQAQEVEANAFAAELLMPSFLIKKRDEIWDVSMAAVQRLARDFGASLSSSAVRLVDLAEQPCAVALIDRSEVRWMIRNMKLFWPEPLARHSSLPKGSVALTVVHNGFQTADYSELVPATVWCPNAHALHDTEFLEEVVAMPRLGLGLVLLTTSALPPRDGRSEEVEEDQDDSDVSWLKRW